MDHPTEVKAPSPQEQAPADAALIRGVNLCRSFQMGDATVDVLQDVSLDVAEGEKVFLCGASGAGKTTFLRLLAGLEVPSGGRLEFGSQLASETGRLHLRPERRQRGRSSTG